MLRPSLLFFEYTHVPDFDMPMHSSVFLLLGFTIYSSAQLVDLPAEDPSTAVLQIASTNNAEVVFDSTDDGVGSSDFPSGSPEALLMSQTDDTQLCFSNGNNQRPPKRRLRARQSCRYNQDEIAPNDPPATDNKPPASALQEGEPKEGSAAGGNLNQPSAEQDWIGKPRTSKTPELPPIPGRTPSFQKNDPDPCNGERSYAVCSPLEPTTTWFPLSLIWATGSLEYCRLCTSPPSYLFIPSCFFFFFFFFGVDSAKGFSQLQICMYLICRKQLHKHTLSIYPGDVFN